MSITRNLINQSNVSPDVKQLLGLLVDSGGFSVQAAPAAKTTSTTLTAAELLTRLITGQQGAAGAAAYQLPTGAALEAALLPLVPDLAVGESFQFTVVNLSVVAAEDITLTTNTGWTLVGSMLVESNEATAQKGPVGVFRVRRTAAAAFTLYRAG